MRHAGAHEQAQPVGLHAVGNVQLAAVDDPLIPIANGARLDRRHVGTRVGFGDGHGGNHLAAHGRREIALLQLRRAKARKRRRGHVGVHGDSHRHPATRNAAQLLAEDDGVPVIGTLAAVRRVVFEPE